MLAIQLIRKLVQEDYEGKFTVVVHKKTKDGKAMTRILDNSDELPDKPFDFSLKFKGEL